MLLASNVLPPFAFSALHPSRVQDLRVMNVPGCLALWGGDGSLLLHPRRCGYCVAASRPASLDRYAPFVASFWCCAAAGAAAAAEAPDRKEACELLARTL